VGSLSRSDVQERSINVSICYVRLICRRCAGQTPPAAHATDNTSSAYAGCTGQTRFGTVAHSSGLGLSHRSQQTAMSFRMPCRPRCLELPTILVCVLKMYYEMDRYMPGCGWLVAHM
jgi:hypothetical protein